MDNEKNKPPIEEPLVRDFDNPNKSLNSIFNSKLIIILVAAVVLGVTSGYLFAHKGSGGNAYSPTGATTSPSASKGTIMGSNDIKTFKDTAEGMMKEGGIEGEGAYHLVRSGGESQNVYLTSSSVDLSQLIGKKVKVWGQTQKAQHAGWLMDVGRVEILQ